MLSILIILTNILVSMCEHLVFNSSIASILSRSSIASISSLSSILSISSISSILAINLGLEITVVFTVSKLLVLSMTTLINGLSGLSSLLTITVCCLALLLISRSINIFVNTLGLDCCCGICSV